MAEHAGAPRNVPLLATAFTLAAGFHATQLRKGSGTPYVAHLLGVAELVLGFEGTDTEAAAALLHDAVEDGGGDSALRLIRDSCGHDVAEIVLACSDSTVDTMSGGVKSGWRERKRAYIEHLSSGSAVPGALLVSACDKLHNLTGTVHDYEYLGEPLWEVFKTGWQGQLWYYRSLAATYEKGADPRAARVAPRIRTELGRLEDALRRAGHAPEESFDPLGG